MPVKPYFSIVMPVQNREKLVGEAIVSIIAQSFKDWELIVVDDHSTDATSEVVRSFGDQRIRVLEMPDGATGVARARNFGTHAAKGGVIVVADSDDHNYPDRLKETHDFFTKHSDVDVFYGNIDRYWEESGKTETRWFQPFNAELLKHISFIPHSASAYRKRSFDSLGGYDSALVIGEDHDLWLRFSKAGKQFGYTKKPLVRYRKHAGALTSDIERLRTHQAILWKKHGLKVSLKKIKELAKPEVYEFYKDRI